MSWARRLCGLLTSFAAAQVIVAQAGAAPPAEALADPTRPPYGGRGVGAEQAPVAGPELQSVLISPTRKVAVINGQTVPLGGKFRDATLTRITQSGVELHNAGRVEVLRLFPQVEKKSLRGAAPPGKN
jgi:MSHA biogenesis protein MshK